MRHAKPGCIFVGLCTVDQLALVSSPLKEDEKVHAEAIIADGGGPAATAACAASRSGLRSELLTVLGDDEWLNFSLSSLKTFHVGAKMARVSKKFRTPLSLIFINKKNASRTIIWNSGGIEKIDLKLTRAELLHLTTARALHFDGHLMELAIKISKEARKNGTLISYDCGSVKPDWDKLASLSDVIIASHRFAKQMGMTPRDAAAMLHSRFGAKTAVTCGEQGVWFKDETVRAPRLMRQKKYRAVDTTGCGDVFHGAFLACYMRTKNFKAALSAAQEAAGLKTLAPGGRKPLLVPSTKAKLIKLSRRVI